MFNHKIKEVKETEVTKSLKSVTIICKYLLTLLKCHWGIWCWKLVSMHLNLFFQHPTFLHTFSLANMTHFQQQIPTHQGDGGGRLIVCKSLTTNFFK